MAGSVCTLIEIGMREKVGQVGFLVSKLSISWGGCAGQADAQEDDSEHTHFVNSAWLNEERGRKGEKEAE